jgi:hypothetical protein
VKFLRSPIFWALTAKIKLSPVLDTERDDKGIAVATCTGVLVALGYFLRRSRAMIMTNKLLPVALIAALIGGSVGAVVMHKACRSCCYSTDGGRQQRDDSGRV